LRGRGKRDPEGPVNSRVRAKGVRRLRYTPCPGSSYLPSSAINPPAAAIGRSIDTTTPLPPRACRRRTCPAARPAGLPAAIAAILMSVLRRSSCTPRRLVRLFCSRTIRDGGDGGQMIVNPRAGMHYRPMIGPRMHVSKRCI